jgi:hypothetical protein
MINFYLPESIHRLETEDKRDTTISVIQIVDTNKLMNKKALLKRRSNICHFVILSTIICKDFLEFC